MMESIGTVQSNHYVAYLYTHVKSEKSNSIVVFLLVSWCQLITYQDQYMCNSQLASYLEITLVIILDKYHQICLHRASDASPMLLILMFILNIICTSTTNLSFHKHCSGRNLLNLTMKFSQSMVQLCSGVYSCICICMSTCRKR